MFLMASLYFISCNLTPIDSKRTYTVTVCFSLYTIWIYYHQKYILFLLVFLATNAKKSYAHISKLICHFSKFKTSPWKVLVKCSCNQISTSTTKVSAIPWFNLSFYVKFSLNLWFDCFVYIRQDTTPSHLEVYFYLIGTISELREYSLFINFRCKHFVIQLFLCLF